MLEQEVEAMQDMLLARERISSRRHYRRMGVVSILSCVLQALLHCVNATHCVLRCVADNTHESTLNDM